MEPTEQETRTLSIRTSSRNDCSTHKQTAPFSTEDDDPLTGIYKDLPLYLAAKDGNLQQFTAHLYRISAADNINFHDILSRLSLVGSTLLHVAAKHGSQEVVSFIAATEPYLILSKNFDGETALHLAARSGKASMVEALVRVHQGLLPDQDENNLLRAKNKRGNTALHEAMLKGWNTIAEFLIQNDPEVSYYQNRDEESALYLAARDGLKDCVSLILRFPADDERKNELFKKKSPIKAAIEEKHIDVLYAMFATNQSLFDLRDGVGRGPLHYAAASGYLEAAEWLHSHFAEMATQIDENGSLPIHLASTEGHVDVIKLLLPEMADLGEVLDRDGRNILHLAAMHGRTKVVNFVLKSPHLQELINTGDASGNTPLHLATTHWHPLVVRSFTWDKRVDVTVINDDGMTALDIAEKYMNYRQLKDFLNIQYLTWAALMAARTPRALTENTSGKTKTQRVDAFEIKANFLLLVSILIATVTYAAGFTVPGGYNSSDDDNINNVPGQAAMLKHRAFQIFVLSDVLAMYSSLTAVVILGWTMLLDFVLVVKALNFVLPLFGGSLIMMCVAFISGMYLVVSEIWWLRTLVLVMGIDFVIKLVLLGLPACYPVSSPNILLRYIAYYPFYFLVLLTNSIMQPPVIREMK